MPFLPRGSSAILALCLAEAVRAVSSVHIYPFVAPLLLWRGVSSNMVSVYAGAAESAIAVMGLFAMKLHVWMAARYQHRYLQVFSLIACGVASSLIGFCQEAWQIVILRGIAGMVMIGSILNTIVVGEVATEENKAQAMSWQTAATYTGAMSGAALGGYLAEPFGRVPFIGRWELLVKYPYVLPGMAVLCCSITGGQRQNDVGAAAGDSTHRSAESSSIGSLFRNRSYRNLLITHFISRICYFGSLGLMTAAGQLPVGIGGLGLTPTLIAITLIFLVGDSLERSSTRRVAVISSIGWLLVAAYFPITKLTIHWSHEKTWLTTAIWLAGQALGVLFEGKRNLVIFELFPGSSERALALAVSKQSPAAAATVGPALYGAIFGLSSRSNPDTLGRQIVWIWTGLMAMVALLAASVLTKSRSENGETAEAPSERTALLESRNAEVDP